MIVEFKVENYLSFKEEQILSLQSSSMKDIEVGTVALSDSGITVLESAVVYGANASGKSNLIKAFAFYKNVITNSFMQSQAGVEIDVESFRLNSTTAERPTMMEATFTDGEYLYRYGFEVDRKKVCSEWLYQRMCKKRAKEVELFVRDGNEMSVHAKCPLIQELVNKKMVRPNALLLSVSAQFNDMTSVKILNWLSDTSVLFCSDDETLWESAIRHLDNPQMRSRITTFARYADLGIEEIEKVDNHIFSRHSQFDDEGRETANVTFAFTKNESEGTIKYFSLAFPIIDALDNGKRLLIDELDSKLHPLLIQRIVSLFNSSETNRSGAQLLFTTHDTNLLSAGLFRRDQVWFTQKDNFGATELFSLAEYKVRSTASFEKDYLQGRYGATPIIGNMEQIILRSNGKEE